MLASSSFRCDVDLVPGEYSRIEELEEVVEDLLPYHDDGQLYAEFAEATGRVAHVPLDSQELRRSAYGISGVVKEAPLCKDSLITNGNHDDKKVY